VSRFKHEPSTTEREDSPTYLLKRVTDDRVTDDRGWWKRLGQAFASSVEGHASKVKRSLVKRC
jgi:hypothetical protein